MNIIVVLVIIGTLVEKPLVNEKDTGQKKHGHRVIWQSIWTGHLKVPTDTSEAAEKSIAWNL